MRMPIQHPIQGSIPKEGTTMTNSMALMMTAVAALTTLAGWVTTRVVKCEIPISVQTLVEGERADYLDVPRGMVVGATFAAVLWAALFAAVALLIDL
jgi:hypothetical protein